MNRDAYAIVHQQYEQATQMPGLTHEEAEREFPELLNCIRERVNLVELVRESGVVFKPLSPDAPGSLVGECPFCSSGALLVRST